MKPDERFRGVGPALVTPMRADGRIDLGAMAEHVAWVVEEGVHFVVPCGTTGESATLEPEEQAAVIRRCVDVVDGRVPVIAGAGTNATRDAERLAGAAADAGADAVLTVSPYYNKPNQEGIFRHYERVARAAGIPLFVYNVPGRTGSNIRPATVFRLFSEVEQVVGVKEAAGDIEQAMTLLRDRPDGMVVLSGDDSVLLPLVLLGAEGGISVAANEAPAAVARLVERGLDAGTGNASPTSLAEARALHERLLPLLRANFVDTNPIPVKTALEMMGRGEAHFRLPLSPLADEHRGGLREALRGAGVALAEEGR